MYQRLMGNVRRLKNIDGTTTKIAYAQIPINYNFGANFRNTKTDNNEFTIERKIDAYPNSGVKTNVICNVIKIQLPAKIADTITLSASGKNFWNVNGATEIGVIPNLNAETTYNLIYNTINNFKNESIRKQLNTVLYNLTHGETPYADIDTRETTYENIFATCYYSTTPFSTKISDSTGYAIVNGCGFPQPYLIFYTDFRAFNFIGFINTTPPNQNLELDNWVYTFPTYGILLDNDNLDILNMYYCTYKGV